MAAISLKKEEIHMMRGSVLSLVDFIYKNRFRMQQDDGRQLQNHLNYTLDILSAMENKLAVQMSEPCYSPSCYNTGNPNPQGKTVLYDLKGKTSVVDPTTLPRTNDGWEQQFDTRLLMNPPCYTIPPQNLTNISTIRKASDAQRLKTL